MWLKTGFILSLFVTLSTVLSANYGPVFDDKREDVNVTVGKMAELPCSARHKGMHTIIWVNPKSILVTNGMKKVVDDKRISIHTNINGVNGDWNLRIQHVRYNDTGEYMCQINTSPAKIKRVYLNVQVPPHILRSESSGNLDVVELETVKLSCKATGVPRPTITWYKQQLPPSDTKDNMNEKGEELVLDKVKRFESGVYMCKADNNVPDAAWHRIEVRVQYAPVVKVLNDRIGQGRRMETVLACTVTSYPRSKITWYKNGREVIHSYRYRLELYNGKHDKWSLSLQILNINESDYGDYICKAKNIMGVDEDVTTLYEYREYRTTTIPPVTFYPSPTTTYYEYPYYDNGNDFSHGEILDEYVVLSDGKTVQYTGTHVGRQGSQKDGDGYRGSATSYKSDLLLPCLCIITLVFSL